MIYDTIIIGAGPAGIAAAIQLKRNGLNALLMEKHQVGGLMLNANLIENYPGFDKGITGIKLANQFSRHLKQLNIRPVFRTARIIKQTNQGFTVVTDKGVYRSRSLVIASGTKPKQLDITGETDAAHREKLFYEIKDVPTANRNKSFIVIGGGEAAFDYALNLAGQSKSVDIVFRNNQPRALALLITRARAKKNIRIWPNISPARILVIKNKAVLAGHRGKQNVALVSDCILAAVGRLPCLDFLPARPGKILKAKGLFIAGDVRRGNHRQAIIAAGDGLLAAMQVIDFHRNK
ncbi:MAG: NAD(P)/FAD-dependent oxidoreductase [Candidatus Brocadiia bacterium]